MLVAVRFAPGNYPRYHDIVEDLYAENATNNPRVFGNVTPLDRVWTFVRKEGFQIYKMKYQKEGRRGEIVSCLCSSTFSH